MSESEKLNRPININCIPKRCYKCNCQRFEISIHDQEKCAICEDDEGEHNQVKYYY